MKSSGNLIVEKFKITLPHSINPLQPLTTVYPKKILKVCWKLYWKGYIHSAIQLSMAAQHTTQS